MVQSIHGSVRTTGRRETKRQVIQNAHVDFFCVGPQRTSSTWLFEVLSHHPGIAFPEGVKETKFFDRYYSKGLDWYLWHFRNADQQRIQGEISPSYFDCEDAPSRIFHAFPNAKVIVNVRNPIDQSYSLFRHHYSKGRVGPDFHSATKKFPRILTAGHYAIHAPRWERFFPDRILYVLQDETRSAPQDVLDAVCRFVGVEGLDLPEVGTTIVNSADAPRSRWVARVLSALASVQRGRRMHWTVEFGKQLGLKTAFRGGKPIGQIDDDLIDHLRNHFKKDILWLEQKFERRF